MQLRFLIYTVYNGTNQPPSPTTAALMLIIIPRSEAVITEQNLRTHGD